MEAWKRFANEQSERQKILDFYLELRLEFQKWGYTEDQLEKIQSAPQRIWQLRSLISVNMNLLFREIKNFGFKLDKEEFNDYIQKQFLKINELTPLKDGDNEGDNRGDEDN